MNERRFQSADKRFGVRIAHVQTAKMVKNCRLAGQHETGGIVVGRYAPNHDFAIVTVASDAPGDSQAGRTWFSRGVQGLQNWLNDLWKSDSYYLGEWHFHPFASAMPSKVDVIGMKSIASSKSCHCPEPILLILGGDPNREWHLKVFVYLRGEGLRELPELGLSESENHNGA